MKLVPLLETSFGKPSAVDREAGVIRGVKVLGRESKNGRTYSDGAMAQAAAIYEGLGVNLNHPDRKAPNVDRPVQDGFGWLESVTVKPDGVYGDLHFPKSHPYAGVISEIAERRPERFGLSHNAEGTTSIRDGKTVVESIERVRSVDIVQNPATNGGLFESEEPVKKTMKQFAAGIDSKAKLRGELVKLLEDDAAMGAMDAPADVPAEATPDDEVKAAFRAMVIAAFDDESLDTKATLAKIKDILTAQEKLSAKAESAPAEPAPEGGAPVSESKKHEPDPALVKLQEQVAEQGRELAGLRAEKARNDLEAGCRALLESAHVEETPAKLKALMALSTEPDRKALLESWPKSEVRREPQRVTKPARSAPIIESTGVKSEAVTDGKTFAAAILR